MLGIVRGSLEKDPVWGNRRVGTLHINGDGGGSSLRTKLRSCFLQARDTFLLITHLLLATQTLSLTSLMPRSGSPSPCTGSCPPPPNWTRNGTAPAHSRYTDKTTVCTSLRLVGGGRETLPDRDTGTGGMWVVELYLAGTKAHLGCWQLFWWPKKVGRVSPIAALTPPRPRSCKHLLASFFLKHPLCTIVSDKLCPRTLATASQEAF